MYQKQLKMMQKFQKQVKTDSEIKTEEENTSTYNTGYAQWVEDDDDEE